MFKLAEEKDLPQCIIIAKKFTDFYGIEYDEDSVKLMLEKIIDDGVFLLSLNNKNEITGGVAGLSLPNPWNQKQILFQEMFWWVEEEYRGGSLGIRLLFELESYVPLGNKIIMSTLPQSNIKESTMLKLGYTLKELAFMKG